VLLRAMVELAPPDAIQPADRLDPVPDPAAHERLRRAVPDDRADQAARARRRVPARGRAGAPAAGASPMNDVGSGVIQGGWEFVTAAFVVTAVMLTGYTLSV